MTDVADARAMQQPATRVARAPAKVNLSLHVCGRRADGFHDLESLVAFTGAGDTLRFRPGPTLSLAVTGERAAGAGPLDDNLVLRAARALQERISGLRVGAFQLDKRLPAAAGLGGGSSDAAAALRLLAQENDLPVDYARVIEAAASIGSDIPVCLTPRAQMMRGRGERIAAAPQLPPLFAVLVNPGVAVETAAVFARLGLARGAVADDAPHPAPVSFDNVESLVAFLRRTRNDLEAPASVIAPVIGSALAVLGAARGCLLARMSGSGATCYGLFASRRRAVVAARVIRRDHAHWWTRTALLR